MIKLLLSSELKTCFEQLTHNSDCRSVVLSGVGKGFTAGLDLTELSQMVNVEIEDVGRKGFALRKIIQDYQNSITSVEIVKMQCVILFVDEQKNKIVYFIL